MSVAPRLALFYAGVFFFVGIQLPFWPVWLAGRGLSVSEIGVVLAAALWVKVIVNPLAGLLADRTGRRRGVMILLAATNLAGFLLFVPTHGLWPLCSSTPSRRRPPLR
jgi:PPP family 3-phenylpropionic acid transporter